MIFIIVDMNNFFNEFNFSMPYCLVNIFGVSLLENLLNKLISNITILANPIYKEYGLDDIIKLYDNVNIVYNTNITNISKLSEYNLFIYLNGIFNYDFIVSNENIQYTSKDNQLKMYNIHKSLISKIHNLNNLSIDYNFKNIQLTEENYTNISTPLQLKIFYNNYPKISCLDNKNKMKKLRFCFDLDNTLVSVPKIKGDYTSVEPIMKNIYFLKYLKKFGHEIIIYTARRMKTFNGNEGKVNASIGKITFDTLDKFEIPYDEIYFGKPYADYYIDDKAINAYSNLQTNLGFYMDNIQPRDYNELIENNLLNTYIKKGKDLSGEIYYYNNIPNDLKDLFPIYFGCYDNSYEIEKINGYSVSTLYVNEMLSIDTFKHILNSVKRIHDHSINCNTNIYTNYAKKLKQRYIDNLEFYKQFNNYEETFIKIYNKLIQYETSNKGKCCMIHGDPVFTNILINNYNKIKFIDMRGKQGNNLTLCGDFLYDWAKIYQSLIGYDEILNNNCINIAYKNNMINVFNEYFIKIHEYIINIDEYLEWIKIITNSLLFSLLPLHNNDKCIKFYNLIT